MRAQILHDGQRHHLGYFTDEDAAAGAYNTAAKVVQATGALPQQEGGRRTSSTATSMHRGVSWSKQSRKWQAKIQHGGQSRHLGYFADEGAAAGAYNAVAQAVQATGALPQQEGDVKKGLP